MATPVITDEESNKFKILHIINSVGQTVFLNVFQNVKKFNTIHIKDHLIKDLRWQYIEFEDQFTSTMVDVIDNNPSSGEDYDITLMNKNIIVLAKPHKNPRMKRKWKNF